MDSPTINRVKGWELAMTANSTQSELKQLARRREELKARLEAIQRDLGRGLGVNLEEQAIELENLEVLEEIARVAREELKEIELKMAALKTPD
jgi:hypothetical protein